MSIDNFTKNWPKITYGTYKKERKHNLLEFSHQFLNTSIYVCSAIAKIELNRSTFCCWPIQERPTLHNFLIKSFHEVKAKNKNITRLGFAKALDKFMVGRGFRLKKYRVITSRSFWSWTAAPNKNPETKKIESGRSNPMFWKRTITQKYFSNCCYFKWWTKKCLIL